MKTSYTEYRTEEKMISREIVLSEQPAANLYGLTMLSDDRTQAKDVRDMYQCYKTAVHAEEGAVVPLYIGTKDYNTRSRDFTLFIAGNIQAPGLRPIMLPGGLYAHFPVRARFGYFWGAALRKARCHFYGFWLSHSDYEPRNIDYEFHTQKTMLDSPEVELYFAIKKKAGR